MKDVYFYRKPTELLGGDHDRLMFLEMVADGATPQQATQIVADITRYAEGGTPSCVQRSLGSRDAGVELLQWPIGESAYTVWLARIGHDTIIVGVLLHQRETNAEKDDEAMLKRRLAIGPGFDGRGLTWAQAMDDRTYQELRRAAWNAQPRAKPRRKPRP